MADFKLVINNSFCELDGEIPPQVYSTVKSILTYKNDIEADKSNIFYRLNMLKRYGLKPKKGESREQTKERMVKRRQELFNDLKKLEESEWVCWLDGNKFPTGHLNIVRDVLSELSANYSVDDRREKPEQYLILPWKNKPFEPRYYQEAMIKLGLDNGRGVFESAVGTGKSLIMTYLIKELAVNSLVVVPSRGLLEQLYRDLECWFGQGKVQMVDSGKVRKGGSLKPIRVITIQSLAALQKSGDLQLLISDVDALFLDEFHHAGSASYTNLLPEIKSIYFRFGFTGTFLRNDNKSLDMWGFLSNKLYTYPAWKAIEEGFLTPVNVITYQLDGKKGRKYQSEYDHNYCGSQEILNTVHQICCDADSGAQILILVNKKDKAGKIFHEFLEMQGIDNAYISGDDTKEHINDTIVAFNDKKIRILIGSSVIGEGIDVRSTDHLIMCQGGKSEITVVQAVGRAVRLYEGKNIACVHDFNFINTKYMSKHFYQRKDIYERNFKPEFLEC